MILLSAFLPVYMRDGYYMLGEEKGVMYMIISAVTAALIILAYLPDIFGEREKKSDTASIVKAFVCINLINLVFSLDKKVSFFGLEGWRTGFATMFLMLFFCAAFSEGAILNRYTLAAVFAVPFIIAILVITERFGINLLRVSGTEPSFVACVGNINWYAGYLSVFVPIGVGFAATREVYGKQFYLWSVYSVVMIMSLFVQGSESAILILAGTYGLLIWYALYEKERLLALIIQFFLLGMAMFEVKILLGIFPGKYTYTDNILIHICDMNVGIVLMAASLFVYRIVALFKESPEKSWNGEKYRKRYIVISAILAISAIAFVVYRFDELAQNGRGIIWRMTIDMYNGLSPFRKVVGIGRDCFGSYVYSDPNRAELLKETFGAGNRLTNAHSIILTELIEGGLSGVMCMIFIAFYVLNSLRKCDTEKEPTAIICALPIVSYYLNGMISFSQILSTPYMFICLGLGLYVANGEQS